VSGGPHILVVDDERPIRRFLATALGAHGYDVAEAATGVEALRLAATGRPELVILDLGLPDMDGLEVLQQLREWSAVPVIVVSVREHETDKVALLDAGADDYLTKPFGAGELLARIRAALRRAASPVAQPVLECGALRLDTAAHEVTVDGRVVTLTPIEFDLLRTLLRDAGKVLTHRQLLISVWGPAYETETHLLQVNISNLRRKIEPEPGRPRHLVTEPGVGYRLREPE
jgi:two-component system KDP operon response regulator KdpE